MPNTPVPLTTLTISGFGRNFVTYPGVTGYKIRRRGILGGTNRINYVRNTWDVDSRLQLPPSSGLSGVDAAEALDIDVIALESTIRDGVDLVFSLGTTSNLLSSECVSGTHVADFEWLPGFDGVRGTGGSQVIYRNFHAVVWGDTLVTNADTLITEYSESIKAIGSGGPNTVPVRALTGGVQPQTLSNYTEFWMIQSGHAVGLLSTPDPPLPQFEFVSGVIYPPLMQSVDEYSPKQWGVNRNTGFGIRWSYKCWASFPISGSPLGF